MKKAILLLVLVTVSVMVTAQLKVKPDCGVLTVDVHKGWINEAKPNADPEQIKTKLPCFTSFEKEGTTSTCGGGVFFDDKGIRFYTQRDYIVITDKFKGKFTSPLLGVKKAAMFAKYGNPKLKDANWEAYQMAYGIIVVYYNTAATINKIIISTKTTDDIDLCNQ
ncbi:hypothetical protein ESA94_03450 [Lacibacter luteus]|uniref:Uncharacterized protein n=1 Tax=Lacibacter luteus TaxID=2508719 RepID=A0A4Q1CM51_9BACT|nr:hypothetical protein [Lacibacter luteus]RXK62080.1 hypothetical protein ESA94_03450 [Lacibacter luteus]